MSNHPDCSGYEKFVGRGHRHRRCPREKSPPRHCSNDTIINSNGHVVYHNAAVKDDEGGIIFVILQASDEIELTPQITLMPTTTTLYLLRYQRGDLSLLTATSIVEYSSIQEDMKELTLTAGARFLYLSLLVDKSDRVKIGPVSFRTTTISANIVIKLTKEGRVIKDHLIENRVPTVVRTLEDRDEKYYVVGDINGELLIDRKPRGRGEHTIFVAAFTSDDALIESKIPTQRSGFTTVLTAVVDKSVMTLGGMTRGETIFEDEITIMSDRKTGWVGIFSLADREWKAAFTFRADKDNTENSFASVADHVVRSDGIYLTGEISERYRIGDICVAVPTVDGVTHVYIAKLCPDLKTEWVQLIHVSLNPGGFLVPQIGKDLRVAGGFGSRVQFEEDGCLESCEENNTYLHQIDPCGRWIGCPHGFFQIVDFPYRTLVDEGSSIINHRITEDETKALLELR